jgi:hypothetical protein
VVGGWVSPMEATVSATSVGGLDSPADVLAFARERRSAADRAEADLMQAAVVWAEQHPAESLEAAEVFRSSGYWGGFGDTAVPIAGPGAPLVAEFSVAEFAAAVGMTTDAGKQYLGQALELRYRLPRLWKRVVTGSLPAWKARRVAHETISRALSTDAAAHVDRHLAPVAHKIGVAAIDRLVEGAIARHMPQTAEATRRQAADGRHFDIDHHQISFAGTSLIHGEVDLADALDLDAAVTHRAGVLKDLGCPESLDVRRSMALGDLARHQLALDLPTPPHLAQDPSPGVEEGALAPVSKPRTATRPVVLYLHLHQSAINGAGGVGRVENTRSPVTAEQIRTWCGHRDAQVTVKPVIDLADHVSVDAYEVPDRIAQAVALRDVSCVFPWCTRPARKLRPDQHPCDCDHVIPHGAGGETCTCQLAPLCRRLHRLKTHGGWTYTILEPGSYLWSSPQRCQYLRDHTGTLDVTSDRRIHAPPPDE